MLLSDADIRRAIHPIGKHHPEARLVVEGMSPGAIKPASIDLMLSNHFHVLDLSHEDDHTPIDPRLDHRSDGLDVTVDDGACFLLQPGRFCLASTRERFAFPAHLAGRLEGKSGLGRLGLLVHVSAGFFDPGFAGYPTLELVNMRQRPMRLYPGMPVAEMSIFAMESPSQVTYDKVGKYADQGEHPMPSRYHENFVERAEHPAEQS